MGQKSKIPKKIKKEKTNLSSTPGAGPSTTKGLIEFEQQMQTRQQIKYFEQKLQNFISSLSINKTEGLWKYNHHKQQTRYENHCYFVWI